MKLLEEIKEGWHFRGKNRKTGIWRSLTRFHYYHNGISLCGKYEMEKDGCFLPRLSENDCCSKCLEKLREEKRKRKKEKK